MLKLSNTLSFSWFTGINIYSLGLFRMMLGAVLFIDILFYKFPFIDIFFTDNGILSSSALAMITQTYQCSLLYYLVSDSGVLIFFCITLVLCVLYFVGYRIQIVSILLYICVFSIHERNAPFLLGSDQIFRLALFWSIFLPLNSSFCFFSTKQKQNSEEIKSIAVFTILLQIGVIYFFNAYSKNGKLWSEGTAVAYALMIPFHKAPLADWVIASPLMYKFLTYSTKIFEYAIPVLIFSPVFNVVTRSIAIFLIFAFHWGMLPFLNVGDFYLASLPLVCILIPHKVWDTWLTSFKRSTFNIKVQHKADFSFNNTFQNIINKFKVAFIAICILVVLSINIKGFKNISKPWKDKIAASCNCVGLSQQWSMFAPNPTINNGYTVIVGQLSNNVVVNLRTGEYIDVRKLDNDPFYYHSLSAGYVYLDHFYHQFRTNPELSKTLGENWARFEANRWNQNNSSNKVKVVYIARVFMFSQSPGNLSKPELVKLYEQRF